MGQGGPTFLLAMKVTVSREQTAVLSRAVLPLQKIRTAVVRRDEESLRQIYYELTQSTGY